MNSILFRDLLMNMLLGLTALVVLVLANINPPAKSADAMPPPGNIAVLACWPQGAIDVDVWASAPGEPLAVGYSNKSGKVWSLLRDDMGVVNDESPVNCESLFARAAPEGEFAINLHGYSLPGEITVHVEIAINGRLIVSTDMALKPKQERTVVRFKLDGRGGVVQGSVNSVYLALRSEGK